MLVMLLGINVVVWVWFTCDKILFLLSFEFAVKYQKKMKRLLKKKLTPVIQFGTQLMLLKLVSTLLKSQSIDIPVFKPFLSVVQTFKYPYLKILNN